jgi:hypothetical protein
MLRYPLRLLTAASASAAIATNSALKRNPKIDTAYLNNLTYKNHSSLWSLFYYNPIYEIKYINILSIEM